MHCSGKMIFGVEGVDPSRRARLIRLLDVDLYQRASTMSDGQRRRVQICMGLLRPYDVRACSNRKSDERACGVLNEEQTSASLC
jgi:CCR4-NOT complex subunit CAF16